MRNLYEQCLKLTQFAAMEFEEIFQFSQERLKQALETELIENGYAVRKQRGFLYAEGTVPVLLVAHLDTVHRTQPETICYSADGTVMMSPQGIGGDDRAGVYMILRLIQSCHCHVLFCEDEETGGHGARAFTKSGIKPDVNYIVELDRTGSNDAVFYQCRNRQFERHINSFGFQTAFGSFSDISILAPHLNLAAVNLSTGYYHAHQPGEYVRLDKVEELIGRVEKLLQTKTEQFSYTQRFTTRKLGEPNDLQRKRLIALSDAHFVRINHQNVADGRGYYMDISGRIYLYLEECDRMVHIGDAEAFCMDGSAAAYQAGQAKEYKTIEMEEAMRLLEQERRRLARCKDAYQAGVDTLEEYRDNKARLEERIRRIEEQAASAAAAPESLDKAAYGKKSADILRFLETSADEGAKNEVLRSVVDHITYEKASWHLAIYFYT